MHSGTHDEELQPQVMTVRVQADDGATAGGVFDLRIVRPRGDE
jgi:hypothetical protein